MMDFLLVHSTCGRINSSDTPLFRLESLMKLIRYKRDEKGRVPHSSLYRHMHMHARAQIRIVLPTKAGVVRQVVIWHAFYLILPHQTARDGIFVWPTTVSKDYQAHFQLHLPVLEIKGTC